MKGIIVKNDINAEIHSTSEIAEISSLIDIYSPPLTSQQVLENPKILNDADIIMTEWGSFKFDEKILQNCPNLKAVFYAGGSIRFIVTPEFWKRNIVISSAWGANAVSVAQYTLAQIISCSKRLRQYARQSQKQRTFIDLNTYHQPGTYKSTIGIISLGQIGQLVCKYLNSVTEMNIIAYDPFYSQDKADKMNIKMVSLEDIFKNSDIVSLHTPALKETEGMIKGDHFRMMKHNSSFINTARGIVVRENEMIQALKERPDIEAVIDVTYPEPPGKDNELFELENVFLTPHIAGCMGPECKRMGYYMIEELKRFLNGEKLKWQISREKTKKLA